MSTLSGSGNSVNHQDFDYLGQLSELLKIRVLSVTFFKSSRPRKYVGLVTFHIYFLKIEIAGDTREFRLGELADFSVQRKFRALVADKTGCWPTRLDAAHWDMALAALTAAAVTR